MKHPINLPTAARVAFAPEAKDKVEIATFARAGRSDGNTSAHRASVVRGRK